MQRRMLTLHRSELWLLGVRAGLALILGLAIGLSPYLHLRALVGSLGMYAVTDGVLTALARHEADKRYGWAEASLSVLLGLAMMLNAQSERGLLLLFCARNLLLGCSELMAAWKLDGARFLGPRRKHAFFAYAGLSALLLSTSFLILVPFGYGAVDLHACLGGQLAIWAGLMFAHVHRSRRASGTSEPPYLTGPERGTLAGRERTTWS